MKYSTIILENKNTFKKEAVKLLDFSNIFVSTFLFYNFKNGILTNKKKILFKIFIILLALKFIETYVSKYSLWYGFI